MPSSTTHWESSAGALLLFMAVVAGLVQLSAWLMSRQSKWRAYALRYAAPERPVGRVCLVRWAAFGKRGDRCKYTYKRFVRLIFTEQGLFFTMGFPYQTFHKPFLMPWAKVRQVEHYDGPSYRKYMVTVDDGPDEIYLEMMAAGCEGLVRFYKGTIHPGDPRME